MFWKSYRCLFSIFPRLIVSQNPKMEQPSVSKNGSSTSTPSQKKLILMCGLPGAGKTTTAHRIRQALD
ncbi:MAG: zeta toxin family protein, partial [Nitrosopumilaceae archaeon]